MRTQRSFLLACFVLTSMCVAAQKISFEQSFGLSGGGSSRLSGVAVGKVDTSMITANYAVSLLQFGIVYYPRFEFVSWKTGSLSIGSPLMVGFAVSAQYRSNDFESPAGIITQREGLSAVTLAFSVPVVVDLNIGLHSAGDESRRNIGLYVGAGYGYDYNRIKTSAGKVFYDSFDPVFRGGIRLGGAWENRFTIGFNVRGILQSTSSRMFEIHLLKDL